MNCKNCKKHGCSLAGKNHEMSFECKAYIGKTNADRIRAMTDEEMASILTDDFCELICHSPVSCDGNCEIKMLEWLKKESAP